VGIVSDIKLNKTKTDPRLMQMLQEMVAILNEGGYEEKSYTSSPTASDPGFEGETRRVITGATFKVYKYYNGSWYSSQAFDLVT
jgi:hypothetical protein